MNATVLPTASLRGSLFKEPRGGIRERISISFSGGKTSAMMTKILLDLFRHSKEVVVTFANTGQEHPETLEFIRRCDEEFDFRTVWLEAVVHHGSRKSCTHRIVDFASADREGKVFESVIEKYGIPNRTWGPCNREMKVNTMRSYLRSIGWKNGDYSTAVGIRADEIDRASLTSMALGVFYPMADNEIRKEHVRLFWAAQKFNLNIPEHWGNCITCFKKSDRKLLTIAKELPDAFEFNRKMERLHRETGAGDKSRAFFRRDRLTDDIFAEASMPFVPFVDDKFIPYDVLMDEGDGGCGSGCEIGTDGNEFSDPYAEPLLTGPTPESDESIRLALDSTPDTHPDHAEIERQAATFEKPCSK